MSDETDALLWLDEAFTGRGMPDAEDARHKATLKTMLWQHQAAFNEATSLLSDSNAKLFEAGRFAARQDALVRQLLTALEGLLEQGTSVPSEAPNPKHSAAARDLIRRAREWMDTGQN